MSGYKQWFKYLAVRCPGGAEERPQLLEQCKEMVAAGWELWLFIPWAVSRGGGVWVYRRAREEERKGEPPVRAPEPSIPDPDLLDEEQPRMWTEKELDERILKQLGRATELLEKEREESAMGTQGSVLYERVLQVDIGRLERRNTELQAAIDAVVAKARNPSLAMEESHIAVVTHLYPLATKEE